MLHRIQLTFNQVDVEAKVAKANALMETIKERYSYVGHVKNDPTLDPGQWCTTKRDGNFYAIIHVNEEESTITAEDLELLSTTLV